MGIGLALSGGGIRGVAHIGVLKALDENNIEIDAIGGTSSGALVAVLYAMGYSPYYIYILFKRYAKEIINIGSGPIINGIRNYIVSKKLKISGLKDGVVIERLFDELARRKKVEKVADIKMPIAITSVDVSEAKEYIFTNYIPKKQDEKKYVTDISVGKAVRASSSFPIVFSPCKYEKHTFLDGGVLDNIPVISVKDLGVNKVMAVNFNADEVNKESDFMDIVMKNIDIMGNKISEKDLKASDYILTVPTDKVGLLDVEKMDKCYKFGYEAVINNLEEIKKVLLI